MAETTVVNYEQMQSLTKKFADEGEALAEVLASLRQRVHDLHSNWIGAGSEAFFDEMETIVIPSMQRLCEALHFTAETSHAILELFRAAEEEAAGAFKGDLEAVNLGTTDFGANLFGAGGISTGGINLGTTDFGAGQFGAGGGAASGVNLGETDFGAGQFGAGGGSVGGAGASLGATDFGAGQFQGAAESGGLGQSAAGGVPGEASGAGFETGSGGAGSGTGGGSAGSGLQGNLDAMGAGMGSQTAGEGFAAGAAGQGAMPDYIYSSQSAAPQPGVEPSAVSGEASADLASGQPDQQAGGAGAAGAAGVIGGAGAAVGGVAKAVKKKKESS